ncbi:MAG: hypothetical protein K9N00_00815 [Candidatus Marinimicrobia bacterium]|nr:hypothetical protein [Candidatus Neomarinimicrobiota bacterium]
MNWLNNKTLVLSLALFLFMVGCESIVESIDSSFKEEEYKVMEIDEIAAQTLSDTTYESIRTATVEEYMKIENEDTTINYVVTHADTSDTLDNNDKSSIFNTIYPDSNWIAEEEINYQVKVSGDIDETYQCLKNSEKKKIVIYMNNFLGIEIYDTEGGLIEPNSSYFPMETIAKYKDIIKTRTLYDLSSGNYLIKFITSDKTTSNTFNLAILEEK